VLKSEMLGDGCIWQNCEKGELNSFLGKNLGFLKIWLDSYGFIREIYNPWLDTQCGAISLAEKIIDSSTKLTENSPKNTTFINSLRKLQ